MTYFGEGQHVAFASDALANAVIKMGTHAERVAARITVTRLNGDLPPFMQPLHLGCRAASWARR